MNNYNLISYIIYLPITFYITVVVGWILYKKGIVFLNDTFNSNLELASILNRFLLLGYYLLNLGYAAVSIHIFSEINSIPQLIEELSKRIGMLIIGLAIMHYFNMYSFSHFNKQIQKLYSIKH
jgi:NO-binding membrane sensor protein with MHYT domain